MLLSFEVDGINYLVHMEQNHLNRDVRKKPLGQKGKPVQKRKKKTSRAGKPAVKRHKAVEEGEEENFDKVMPPPSDNSDMVKVSPLDNHIFRRPCGRVVKTAIFSTLNRLLSHCCR